MKRFVVLLLAMLCSLYDTATAQDQKIALVPLPSIEDFSRGKDGWSFGVGLGVEYETAYEGSDEFEFELDKTKSEFISEFDRGEPFSFELEKT